MLKNLGAIKRVWPPCIEIVPVFSEQSEAGMFVLSITSPKNVGEGSLIVSSKNLRDVVLKNEANFLSNRKYLSGGKIRLGEVIVQFSEGTYLIEDFNPFGYLRHDIAVEKKGLAALIEARIFAFLLKRQPDALVRYSPVMASRARQLSSRGSSLDKAVSLKSEYERLARLVVKKSPPLSARVRAGKLKPMLFKAVKKKPVFAR